MSETPIGARRTGGPLRGFWKTRRAVPSEQRPLRLASSVRLPWAVGLALLLLSAAATPVVIGRVAGPDDIPDLVLTQQEAVAREAAQSVRRGLNEGVDDLSQLGSTLARLGVPLDAGLEPVLAATRTIHGRYSALYLMTGPTQIAVQHGTGADLSLLETPPPYDEPGAHDVVETPGGLVLPLYSPIIGADDAEATVVGHYDVAFLRFALEPVLPGDAWVVAPSGRVLATSGGSGTLEELPSQDLREAAVAAGGGGSGAKTGGGGVATDQVTAWAPITGPGPGGQLGLGIVTARSVESLALPSTEVRRAGQLGGITLALVILVVFAWLYASLIAPIFTLNREADRIALGDLTKPVAVRRYDEVGLISRALERIRVELIRRRAQSP